MNNFFRKSKEKTLLTGLEPAVFGLEVRRLSNLATRASFFSSKHEMLLKLT